MLTNRGQSGIIFIVAGRDAWKHSSAGRAPALQAGGHRFEPYCFHHYGPVVQLVRTLACHARGQGFESPSGRQFFSRLPTDYALIAQLVEQGTENPRVVGSIPTGGTISCGFSSFGRARPCQGRGGGFEPRNPLQQKRKSHDVSWLFCKTAP